MNDYDKIKLYSQGAYGCIYKPGLTCKGKAESAKFIRKIQENSSSCKNEIKISGYIKKIKKYKQYFAPIIESCPIAINTIENEEIKKCEIINKTSEKYVSNKIRYVGKNTLADYLLDIYKIKPKSFLKTLFSTNIDILEEVTIMNTNQIIHMDLKENNIIIDEHLNKPIIIDFGLSYHSKDLNDENMNHYFYTYQDYSPWCFDINIINCILNTIVTSDNNTDINTTTIKKNDLDSICNKFITDSKFLQSNCSKEELNSYKKNLIEFVDKLKDKTLKQVIDEVLKYSNTWDNYAVAVIYIAIIKDNKLDSINSKLIEGYNKLLKSIILSSPDNRPSSNDTKNELLKISQKVLKSEKMDIQKQIINNSLDSQFISEQEKKTAVAVLDNLTKEKDVYKD